MQSERVRQDCFPVLCSETHQAVPALGSHFPPDPVVEMAGFAVKPASAPEVGMAGFK